MSYVVTQRKERERCCVKRRIASLYREAESESLRDEPDKEEGSRRQNRRRKKVEVDRTSQCEALLCDKYIVVGCFV